ncbi:flavin reductase family protein [Nocardioides pantholopis]|uniref:flavin reductase family protein n=1 Tax=Nocardioides pantholopis TaxID=2483798 RepID=UPI000FD91149|nr:flavin reductase family protein [Nocardioides pantholopis]
MPEQDAFSTIMSSVDTPLIVVTTGNDTDGVREWGGCLVGFHTQASIDPERYCLWLSKANHTTRVAQRSTHLVVHFLTADDLALAERFGTLTGDHDDKFAGLRTEAGPGGVPVLLDCPHRLVVRRTSLLDEGGDHLCLATEPVAVASGGPFTPLRLSDAAHLTPGHEAEERHAPPTERAPG